MVLRQLPLYLLFILLSRLLALAVGNQQSIIITEYDKYLLARDSYGNDDSDFPFTTVVDILSQNVEFSTFLRILQRNGDIPYLNELENFTIIAPVNSAFVFDNNIELEDITSLIGRFDVNDYIVHDHVIDLREYEWGVYVFATPTHPFTIDIKTNGFARINDVRVVDRNMFPNMQNASVLAVGSLLPKLPSLHSMITSLGNDQNQFNLSVVSRLFELVKGSLGDTSNVTILLPTNECFENSFNELELNYLLKDFKYSDKDWFVDKLFLANKLRLSGVHGGMLDPKNITNLNNERIELSSKKHGNHISVNKTDTQLSNILYDKGVAHVFDNISALGSGIRFNAAKYLLGLNASDFVNELYFRNLKHLIDSPDGEYTIFLPQSFDTELSDFSRNNLLYHFVNSKIWLSKDFLDTSDQYQLTKMYNSMFCSSYRKLGRNCQRLRITKSEDNNYTINDRFRLSDPIPYQIDNTLIYVIDDGLELPGDMIHSVNPFLHCSSSLRFLQKLNLLGLKPNYDGYTVFLPCFDSWSDMELNVDYLRRNISALTVTMKNLILNGIFYTDDIPKSVDVTNLYGEQVYLTSDSDNTSDHEIVLINLSTLRGNLNLKKNMDIMFNQGVIHPLTSVPYPNSLEISLRNLIETTDNAGFLHLLDKFQSFKDIIDINGPYSFLIPTPKSFIDSINLNSTNIEDLLLLHIIPNEFTDAILNCGKDIHTKLGPILNCCEISSQNYVLKIKDGQDKEVRILKKGCTSINNQSCVFLIDKPFSLDWINREKYHVFLPGLSFAIGLIIGIICLFLIFILIITGLNIRQHHKAAYTDRDPNETTRLLHQSNLQTSNKPHKNLKTNYGSTGNNVENSRPFESLYSENSSSAPIKISHSLTERISQDENNLNGINQ
ncbi:uncharacterized protein Ecym_8273 [Eremothecium cymbalariae DBVPG|uniref:FAS1 domain-containing protein n=1 Tax=Eremothecium cymbalariae (strain CBS 270.75 / DBVPG 7215 / KCTC 17166 / NRRL Y-17582) TaxID=931890 RepID=G8JXI1_ERECY|nr:Hypothetical protein Ecym_8273 [Eremothecium cymbalariae DBVPG\